MSYYFPRKCREREREIEKEREREKMKRKINTGVIFMRKQLRLNVAKYVLHHTFSYNTSFPRTYYFFAPAKSRFDFVKTVVIYASNFNFHVFKRKERILLLLYILLYIESKYMYIHVNNYSSLPLQI